MQFDNRKKIVKLKWAVLAEGLITFAFFLSVLLAETCVSEYYLRIPAEDKFEPLFSVTITNMDYSWRLFFAVLAVIFLALSHFEVRLLTADNKRFLGYKAYILFFYKLVYAPVSLGFGVLTSLYVSPAYYVYILMQFILILPYYGLLLLFGYKYRYCLGEPLFLSYLQSVKNWWEEGALAAASRPHEKKKREKPQKPAEPRGETGAESALPRRKIGRKSAETSETSETGETSETDETPSETPAAATAEGTIEGTADAAPTTADTAAETAEISPAPSPEPAPEIAAETSPAAEINEAAAAEPPFSDGDKPEGSGKA